MSVAAYPEYKNSGVEWLGDLPAHWVARPLKSAFQIVGGATPKSDNETFWSGDIVWLTPGDLSGLASLYIDDSIRRISALGLASCAATLVPAGSIVLSTRAPIGSLAITTVPACSNQGCKALVPAPQVSALFAAFALSVATEALNVRGRGSTFLEISGDELGAFKMALPPLPEQTAIASFLDRETGKIDALVDEQRQLITLLKEKRQAVISHAVTKGLDPNAEMKDSGVEWLGEVPAHWDVKRFKHLINSIEQGWSPQCEASPAETENDWAVLKVGCVNGGLFNAEENKTLPPELTPIESLGISEGDLLISRANTRELVGSTAVATKAYPRLMLCDKLYRLRFQPMMMLPQLASFYLATPGARGQIEVAATGASSSMVNIGQSTILEMEIAVPPLAEQGRICLAAMAQGGDFRRLVDAAETAIAFLAERRAALITAAVTGNIDVRGLVTATTAQEAA